VLYDVDMRLRPSGRAGPVASRIDAFADYQEREAWTWEHMALTRARVISASPAFRKKIEDIIRSVLTRPRDPAGTAGDVADMRRAIALEKGEDDIWDLKLAAGGLVDIDFIAQYLQLAHAAENPTSSASRRCRCSTTPRGSACCRKPSRSAALGGAALSRSDADPAALRHRQIQPGNLRRKPAARDGARRRHA
jgi:glutamine synthetase adenylyltransferase